MADRRIRDATPDDAAAVAAIYAPYVTDTVISFETVPPAVEEMARRMAAYAASHAWLVLEEDGEIIGYAYAHPFAERWAYQWSCEVTVYLAMGLRRSGAGRALYDALFDRLAARGFRRVFAGVSLPNDASIGLHRACGFEPAGVFRQVGWKDGAWHDVAWWQRTLLDAPDPPTEPR
jgi:L-amino acid N-acyltransferase YncA